MTKRYDVSFVLLDANIPLHLISRYAYTVSKRKFEAILNNCRASCSSHRVPNIPCL